MKVFKKIPTIFQFLIWTPMRFLIALRYAVTISGQENLDLISPRQGLIIAANHESLLDPIIIRTSLPLLWSRAPLYYISMPSEEYRHIPFFGRFFGGLLFRILGGHPAIKSGGNYKKSLKTHLRILRRRGSVCIFPQGERNHENVRPGVAYLAQNTNSAILPVHIVYEKKIAKIIIGQPISLNKRKGLRRGAEEIMDKVYTLQ